MDRMDKNSQNWIETDRKRQKREKLTGKKRTDTDNFS